jgi:regulator of cell morphogenesis and NO signaling
MLRLIQHIVRVHHQYIRRELPRLAAMSRKLGGKHGQRAPELIKVEWLLEELSAEMFAHIEKEEQILFPFIAHMEVEPGEAYSTAGACFRSVAQPVSMMMREHESAGRIVAELRKLTGGFETPAWGCATHLAFYAGLRGFEADLGQHVHLENDVLFPRAIEMEGALNHRV